MKTGILGTGIVGRTLSKKLSDLGYEVTMGTRNIDNTLSREENDSYGNPPVSFFLEENPDIQLADIPNTIRENQIIFNCTKGLAILEILNNVEEEHLNTKILVDVANPLDFSSGFPPTLSVSNTDSLGELIQRAYPELKVVKTLNTMNADLMVNPSRVAGDHNVFISGDHDDAKKEVVRILRSFGWKEENILDLGDISTSRGTEMLLPIWTRLYGKYQDVNFNFKIVRNDGLPG